MTTAKIKLPCGRVCLVDKADVSRLAGFNLFSKVRRSGVYVTIAGKRGMPRPCVHLHTLLTGWPETDHVNGNGLDNRRSNLRRCTHAQNVRNRKKNCGSKYKGATFNKRLRQWVAQIGVNGKKIHIGVFPHHRTAAKAYDAAAVKYHGEFARLNFTDGRYD